jgi:hypothetical protein
MKALRMWLAMGLLLAAGWVQAQTEAADADWRYRIQPTCRSSTACPTRCG